MTVLSILKSTRLRHDECHFIIHFKKNTLFKLFLTISKGQSLDLYYQFFLEVFFFFLTISVFTPKVTSQKQRHSLVRSGEIKMLKSTWSLADSHVHQQVCE